jgi:DNA-binding NtrC family response regulator
MNKRIMIVDDEQSILLSLAHALRAEGVEVLTYDQVEDAETALDKGPPFDLVIADIRMSGIDGIQGLALLSYIKERYATEVIIMTGFGSKEIEGEAYSRGALHFFNKPIDITQLQRAVASIGIPTKNYA